MDGRSHGGHAAGEAESPAGAPLPRELPPQFHQLLQSLPAAVYLCDAEGLITYFNAPAVRIWGRRPALRDPLDRYCGSFRLYSEDGTPLEHSECWMALALRERRAFEGCVVGIETPAGERRWALAHASPSFGAGGELLGAVNVLVDITERKLLEQALARADARKDEFLAVLGHELRNPLAPIANMVERLRHDPAGLDAREGLDVIERQVRQLTRLVDDLLDVGRIMRGTLEVRPREISLAEVVSSAVETASAALDARGQRLELRVPDDPPLVAADLVRLSQAVQNLLLNAARYTPAGGNVTLSVETVPAAPAAPGEAIVRVADDGVGIGPGKLEEIFELFAQLGRQPHGPRDGLGVGLTLAREIVERHGGSLRAASAGHGRGSSFEIRLPLVAAPKRAGERKTDPARPARPRRVLVVDDHEDAGRSLALLLGVDGHETLLARCGTEALRVADEQRPEVVLLDIGLPDLNGLEVCRSLRERDWGRQALLVAVTGWGRKEDRERTRAAGFDAHLTKPVELAAVRALLERRSAASAGPLRGARRPRAGA